MISVGCARNENISLMSYEKSVIRPSLLSFREIMTERGISFDVSLSERTSSVSVLAWKLVSVSGLITVAIVLSLPHHVAHV